MAEQKDFTVQETGQKQDKDNWNILNQGVFVQKETGFDKAKHVQEFYNAGPKVDPREHMKGGSKKDSQ